jgi:hypothetical protein
MANMSDVEDDYLDLYEALLDNSEFAAGKPGTRFDFDSATWAISALSSVLTIVGTSFLSGLGEQLAESTKERLKRLGAKLRKPSHESNVEELTEIRRITIELKAADPSFALPPDVRSAIAAELVESGLDADRAADIAARVARAISDE